MNIRIAELEDYRALEGLDRHICPNTLKKSLKDGNILIAEEKGELLGWLRWNLFWDSIPFMNMLFVLEQWRDQGVGKKLVLEWEAQMGRQGHSDLMTSTASEEYAQHFYRKLGYAAVGGFLPPGESYELLLAKNLSLPKEFALGTGGE